MRRFLLPWNAEGEIGAGLAKEANDDEEVEGRLGFKEARRESSCRFDGMTEGADAGAVWLEPP
jgi:hypothetical protein